MSHNNHSTDLYLSCKYRFQFCLIISIVSWFHGICRRFFCQISTIFTPTFILVLIHCLAVERIHASILKRCFHPPRLTPNCPFSGSDHALTFLGVWIFLFFLAFNLLSVLLGHLVFSSPPQRPITSDFEGISIPYFIQ